MQTTHYENGTLEQITVTATDEGYNPESKALLTRFKGERGRCWSVRGFSPFTATAVICHNGPCERFTRAEALEMAERWVTRGWDFL